jgi:NADPH:quinone reductase-like Zn-dependent oxidoreductase
MRAYMRTTYGPPESLELRDVPMPVPKDDEVLVRVRASSVNMGDLDYLYGRPWVARLGTGLRGPKDKALGLDIAGVVESVGARVTRFRPGDEVFGDLTQCGFGAFAEYAIARESAIAHKPASLSFEAAATLPQSAIMALQAMRGKRQVGRGDHVLVNGASGNVGPFAVQIAKAFGAEVTGVSSTAKMDLVRAAGADHVLDYTREDFTRGGQRYDRILDVFARHSVFACRRALSRGGVYVCIGGTTARFFAAITLGPLITIADSRSMGLMHWWRPMKQDDVATLVELVEAGSVSPFIDRTFTFDELIEALRYVDDGRSRGKVVITV